MVSRYNILNRDAMYLDGFSKGLLRGLQSSSAKVMGVRSTAKSYISSMHWVRRTLEYVQTDCRDFGAVVESDRLGSSSSHIEW